MTEEKLKQASKLSSEIDNLKKFLYGLTNSSYIKCIRAVKEPMEDEYLKEYILIPKDISDKILHMLGGELARREEEFKQL